MSEAIKELKQSDEVYGTLAFRFKDSFEDLQAVVHDLNHEKGWYDDPTKIPELGTMLMNAVGEIAEANDAVRKGNPESEKIPGFSQVEEELADAVIRLMDTSEYHSFRLAEAIIAKLHYNSTREYRHGGKAY